MKLSISHQNTTKSLFESVLCVDREWSQPLQHLSVSRGRDLCPSAVRCLSLRLSHSIKIILLSTLLRCSMASGAGTYEVCNFLGGHFSSPSSAFYVLFNQNWPIFRPPYSLSEDVICTCPLSPIFTSPSGEEAGRERRERGTQERGNGKENGLPSFLLLMSSSGR